MISRPHRIASGWSGAVQRLAEVTPKGWRAEQGHAGAAVTRARAASLNVAYDMDQEPDLPALDEMAVAVGRLGLPWSIVVRRRAVAEVTELAARHGLTGRGA